MCQNIGFIHRIVKLIETQFVLYEHTYLATTQFTGKQIQEMEHIYQMMQYEEPLHTICLRNTLYVQLPSSHNKYTYSC